MNYLGSFRAVAYVPPSDAEVQFPPSSCLWIVPGTVEEMEAASTNLRLIYDGSGE